MSQKAECMIRLDDITPDMDWGRFYRAKEIFNRYKICPLIGVVPDNQDGTLHKEESKEEFWDIIRTLQSEGWAVAQHGTFHCYETKDSGILGINPFSEFAGLAYKVQLQKLQAGKQILEENGIRTDIFMAPGHTYDKNTLKALRECGFSVITDGLSSKPYMDGGILCIPCRLSGLKKPKGIDTVCLHTNLMNDQDMAELETFCKTNQDVMVSFNPDRYRKYAAKKTVFIKVSERVVLKRRVLKDRIANSKRLAWYMQKTSHANSKVKWIKRLICLPLLFCYQNED